MRARVTTLLAAVALAPLASAQDKSLTNSVGMEFVLVQPGTFVVGRFEPPYPRPEKAPQKVDAGDLRALVMGRGDTNGDGAVSSAEWAAMARTFFEEIDGDGSRQLIRPELTAGWPRALGAAGFGAPAFFQPENVAARNTAAAVFRLADADGDGFVPAREWEAMFDSWFAKWSAGGSLGAEQLSAELRDSIPYPLAAPALTDQEYRRIEQDARADYREGFTVRIEQPYYIGRFEVTQEQWTKVMGSNPSTFKASSRHPVDSVTWERAQEFVKRLNALERTDAYRLPTEFEWEYAARAGRSNEISWTAARREGYFGLGGNRETRAVGTMAPNPWGLYDTLGNVWEWVADFYNEKIFADPVPPEHGTVHVLKGGGFVADVKNATYATHAAGPGNGFDVGFRVVRAARQN